MENAQLLIEKSLLVLCEILQLPPLIREGDVFSLIACITCWLFAEGLQIYIFKQRCCLKEKFMHFKALNLSNPSTFVQSFP